LWIIPKANSIQFSSQFSSVKACPHWFPKQDTLYQETGDFVAVSGNKVNCFRIQICRFWQGRNGNKISCFRI